MVPVSPEAAEALILAQDKFVWEVPSFEKRERGRTWYIGMILIAVFLVAYAIYTANFLFAFLVVLMAILLLLTNRQEPVPMLVQIGDNGVVINGKLHLYQDLDTFSLIYQPPLIKVLYIETRNILTPRLRITLDDQDPVAIREQLKQFLKEDLDLRGEYVSDIIGRLLRI
jgi:hypothetical protein